MASDEAIVSLSRPWSILAAHWLQVVILTIAFVFAYAAVVVAERDLRRQGHAAHARPHSLGIQAGHRGGKRCGCYFGTCDPHFPRR